MENRIRVHTPIAVATLVSVMLLAGCNSMMPELAEWKGRPINEFIDAFSVGHSIQIKPTAAHFDFPNGRSVYGVYLPGKSPDGKIHPTPNADGWPHEVAAQVNVENGIIVSIRPASLIKKKEGPPEFYLAW